jgi:hypothetical protein
VAVGRRLVHLRPAEGAAQTKILPSRIEASAYNDATGRIVAARLDGTLVFHELATLPLLQATVPAPAGTTDTSATFSLDWSQTSGEPLRYVYQTRPAGSEQWTRTDTSWIYSASASPLTVGTGYLSPETDYEVRFCLYGIAGRESDWTPVLSFRTAIPRPTVLPPYGWQASEISANMNEPIVFPVSPFAGDALSYTLENAPEGLTYDPETLAITGLLATPGRHTFRLVARNPGGSVAISVVLLVRNTSPRAAFSRYAGRQNSTLDPLDGRWTLSRSGNSFTGSINTYVGNLSFKTTLVPGDSDLVGYVTERKLQGVPVTIELQWDRALDRCTIRLYNEEFGSSTSPDSGYATTWASKTRPYPHAGRHTAIMPSDPDAETDPAHPTPEGCGHLIVDLAPDGTATLKGETALGSKITLRTFVSDQHSVPVFHLPDSANLSGTFSLESVEPELFRLIGSFEWLKFTDPKASAYRDGFLQSLLVFGAPLPAVGKTLPPLDPLANSANRATLTLSGGGLVRLSKPITQALVPAPAGLTAPKPGSTDNPNRVTVKLDPQTGLVTGSAAVLNDAGTKTVRTVKFSGLLVKNPLGDGEDIIGGYFLFPDARGLLQSGRLEISEAETPAVP